MNAGILNICNKTLEQQFTSNTCTKRTLKMSKCNWVSKDNDHNIV